jgi:type VI protein secretion system component Hcp
MTTDNDETGQGSGRQSNRRDFMKAGGLATGGLLGASGGGRTAGLSALAAMKLDSEIDPNELSGDVSAFLFYGPNSGIVGESDRATIGGVDVSTASPLWAVDWTVDASSGPPGRNAGLTISDLVVAKRLDRATPLLYQRVDSGEHLEAARILFFNNNPDSGETQHYLTLELGDARVSGVQLAAGPIVSGFAHLELVGFAPERVLVTDEVNSVEYLIEERTR